MKDKPVSARELIENQEANAPGGEPGPMSRPMRSRPEMPGMMRGGPMRRPADDSALLKDIVLLELVQGQGEFYQDLVKTLVSGQPLSPGHLQHFVDEAKNLPLDDAHKAAVERVKQQLQRKPTDEPGQPA